MYSAELCTFLASGYLLLEILLPLFLLGLLLMAAGNSLYSLLEYSIKLVVDVCEQSALVLIKIINFVRKAIKKLKFENQQQDKKIK